MIELIAAALLTMNTPDYQDSKLDWWREARFGMFIHWGLYAVPAGTWQDKGTGHAEWIRTTAQIPLETYDKFVEEFNPVNFDADAWCEMANDAGMGYIVITSKHHDGFCLFESQHTDFDIMSTPFKRDIMKELADAAPKHDIHMSWYHSIMDWHHPDYLPRRGWEKDRSEDGADMERYRKYLHAQVTELLTNYGPIGVMWFDGEWEATWRGAYGKELYELCITLQPEVIVNNRLGARGGMEGLTGMEGYAGGYGGDYMTPEQEIPDAVDKGLDWETCMTMNNRWGYNANDHNFKSTTDLLQKLSDIVSKNGNFLLNVGPKPNGTFPEESIQRLSEIGDWMDVNGEAIHGTTGSPFNDLSWGRATQKLRDGDSTLYLHVFDWPTIGKLHVPGLAGTIKSARVLGASKETTFEMGEGEVIISVPSEMPNCHIGVVALELVGHPVVYEAPTFKAIAYEFVNDIEVTLEVGSEALDIYYAVVPESKKYSHVVQPPTLYTSPIKVSETATVIAQCYDGDQRVSERVSKKFEKVTPMQATIDSPFGRGKLMMSVYKGNWDEMPNFEHLLAAQKIEVSQISEIPEAEFEGRVHEGLIFVDQDDLYVFGLTSDDGSILYINDMLVVNNDGLHGPQENRGTAPLATGWHRIRIEWFNKAGGASLGLTMGRLGDPLKAIPSESLATK